MPGTNAAPVREKQQMRTSSFTAARATHAQRHKAFKAQTLPRSVHSMHTACMSTPSCCTMMCLDLVQMQIIALYVLLVMPSYLHSARTQVTGQCLNSSVTSARRSSISNREHLSDQSCSMTCEPAASSCRRLSAHMGPQQVAALGKQRR